MESCVKDFLEDLEGYKKSMDSEVLFHQKLDKFENYSAAANLCVQSDQDLGKLSNEFYEVLCSSLQVLDDEVGSRALQIILDEFPPLYQVGVVQMLSMPNFVPQEEAVQFILAQCSLVEFQLTPDHVKVIKCKRKAEPRLLEYEVTMDDAAKENIWQKEHGFREVYLVEVTQQQCKTLIKLVDELQQLTTEVEQWIQEMLPQLQGQPGSSTLSRHLVLSFPTFLVPLRVSCRQANSSSPPSRSQSSITRFFSAASNVRRVSTPRIVFGDSTEMSSPLATITASIDTLDASSSMDVMYYLPLDVDGFAFWLYILVVGYSRICLGSRFPSELVVCSIMFAKPNITTICLLILLTLSGGEDPSDDWHMDRKGKHTLGESSKSKYLGETVTDGGMEGTRTKGRNDTHCWVDHPLHLRPTRRESCGLWRRYKAGFMSGRKNWGQKLRGWVSAPCPRMGRAILCNNGGSRNAAFSINSLELIRKGMCIGNQRWVYPGRCKGFNIARQALGTELEVCLQFLWREVVKWTRVESSFGFVVLISTVMILLLFSDCWFEWNATREECQSCLERIMAPIEELRTKLGILGDWNMYVKKLEAWIQRCRGLQVLRVARDRCSFHSGKGKAINAIDHIVVHQRATNLLISTRVPRRMNGKGDSASRKFLRQGEAQDEKGKRWRFGKSLRQSEEFWTWLKSLSRKGGSDQSINQPMRKGEELLITNPLDVLENCIVEGVIIKRIDTELEERKFYNMIQIGVRQGCLPFPTLFIFINEIMNELKGMRVEVSNILGLIAGLVTDDLVPFAESIPQLKEMLRKLQKAKELLIGEDCIGVCDSYKYLGIEVDYKLSIERMIKERVVASRKALFGTRHVLVDKRIPTWSKTVVVDNLKWIVGKSVRSSIVGVVVLHWELNVCSIPTINAGLERSGIGSTVRRSGLGSMPPGVRVRGSLVNLVSKLRLTDATLDDRSRLMLLLDGELGRRLHNWLGGRSHRRGTAGFVLVANLLPKVIPLYPSPKGLGSTWQWTSTGPS
eukprot:Gb_38961 [translate_table: standard]